MIKDERAGHRNEHGWGPDIVCVKLLLRRQARIGERARRPHTATIDYSTGLLVAQRNDRIQPRSAGRRNPRGNRGYQGKNGGRKQVNL